MNNPSSRSFILLLLSQTVLLVAYTAITVHREGWIIWQTLLSNVSSMTWSGQFNADFACYLVLSGAWILWRNRFSYSSMIIALLAVIMGLLLFAPYLLYLTVKENGDLKSVLIGNDR